MEEGKWNTEWWYILQTSMARPVEMIEDKMVEKVREYLALCGNSFVLPKVEYQQTGETKDFTSVKPVLQVKLPSIEGLAVYLKVGRESIYRWEKDIDPVTKELKYPVFCDIIAELRAIQGEMLINSGLSGQYSPVIAKVLLTKHGYREGIDQTTNEKDLPTPLLNALPNHDSDKEDSSAA